MSTQIERIGVTPRMSKIVRYGGIVYLCGQTAAGNATPDISQQTREALQRVDKLLVEAGSGRSRILSTLIHLKDIRDFSAMNTEWESWLPPNAAPARSTVQATLAAPELLVEFTVVAAAG